MLIVVALWSMSASCHFARHSLPVTLLPRRRLFLARSLCHINWLAFFFFLLSALSAPSLHHLIAIFLHSCHKWQKDVMVWMPLLKATYYGKGTFSLLVYKSSAICKSYVLLSVYFWKCVSERVVLNFWSDVVQQLCSFYFVTAPKQSIPVVDLAASLGEDPKLLSSDNWMALRETILDRNTKLLWDLKTAQTSIS